MNDLQLSKTLGLASIVIGAAELFAGRRLKDALGLPIPSGAVRAFGARELATGFFALAHPDEPASMGLRVAGDALDLAVLGNALLPGNRHRSMAAVATIAVIGMTVLDLAATTALTRRNSKALETARRTRVKQILA